MIGVAYGVVLEGIVATVVRVEADVSRGLPQFSIVGLPDSAVNESRLRIRAAIRNSGLPFPNSRITVNLSPASLRKRGAGLDLAIAMAILSATGIVQSDRLASCGFSAELGLSGRLVPVPGIMNLALSLQQNHYNEFFISREQLNNCLPVPNLAWIGLDTLCDVASWLQTARPGDSNMPASAFAQRRQSDGHNLADMTDVHGQGTAKRGLMIAAAGAHHTLLMGPPGCGKTMLAERFATILPPLTERESLEVYALHQACGSERELTRRPPMRAPHHSLTVAGLIGGGAPPMPGEATLAHRGVLIFDELLEFGRQTLDSLREPLTTRQIRITRGNHTSVFPASFTLIGTLNPCLCGHLGSGTCSCLPTEVRRYWSRISGPFFDRMELVIFMGKSDPTHGQTHPEPHALSSESMQDIVTTARAALQERTRQLRTSRSDVSSDTLSLLSSSEQSLSLSRRGAEAVLSVARTISVLDGVDSIRPDHLAEALAMRVGHPSEIHSV